MVWAQGNPSTITDYIPPETLGFGVCSFTLHEVTDQTTMAVYGETVDANLPKTDLSAKQQQIESIALGLKTYIENHGLRPFVFRLLSRVFGKSNRGR